MEQKKKVKIVSVASPNLHKLQKLLDEQEKENSKEAAHNARK